MTEHALILCREPGRHSTLDKGHEEGGSAYAKAGQHLRSPPGYSRASPPQNNQSLPTLLLCALTTNLPSYTARTLGSSYSGITATFMRPIDRSFEGAPDPSVFPAPPPHPELKIRMKETTAQILIQLIVFMY